MCVWDSFWQCHLPVTLHRYKNYLDRISPWVRPVLNKKNVIGLKLNRGITKWVDLSFNLVLKICKCCVCHLLPNASPLIWLSLHYLTTHETCWDVYFPFTCATNQHFWIVLLPGYFLHKHFLFKWGLPYCMSPLCHPVTRIAAVKNPLQPLVSLQPVMLNDVAHAQVIAQSKCQIRAALWEETSTQIMPSVQMGRPLWIYWVIELS